MFIIGLHSLGWVALIKGEVNLRWSLFVAAQRHSVILIIDQLSILMLTATCLAIVKLSELSRLFRLCCSTEGHVMKRFVLVDDNINNNNMAEGCFLKSFITNK